MPRNMSFSKTTEQVRNQTKTVTRRVGWEHLQPGERFWAVVKGMGLKPGEKVERICLLECVSNESEVLEDICQWDALETAREGFPELSPKQFVEMFCRDMKTYPRQKVQRIQFKYVEA